MKTIKNKGAKKKVLDKVDLIGPIRKEPVPKPAQPIREPIPVPAPVEPPLVDR